ncbi:hypothetical protein M9458_030110, partial [Cirrhinus mrigala]
PTARVTVDTAVEIVEAMENPTHCTTAEGEQELDLGDLIDFHSEIPILLYSPELLTWENIPPNLLLPPPLIDLFPSSMPSPLDPASPSAHPQPTICVVGSSLVCPSPAPLALSLEDPSTPPPASEAQTLPQSCDPAAPPWLPVPFPPAPPGSLVPLALPWSVVPLPPPRYCTPPAAPRCSILPVLLGSSFPSAPPQSPPTPPSPKPSAPPWPSGFSASPWLVNSAYASGSTTTCSAAIALPPPWLLPPASGPPGILLGSSLRQSHPGRLRASLSALLQPLALLLNPRPPSTIGPSTTRGCAYQERANCHGYELLLCFVLHG